MYTGKSKKTVLLVLSLAGVGMQDYVKPLLRSLHWFPIRAQTECEIRLFLPACVISLSVNSPVLCVPQTLVS